MVNWKNILVAIIPIATTILGSSLIIDFIIKGLPDLLNNPDIQVEVDPNPTLFDNSTSKSYQQLYKFRATVSNIGNDIAKNINITFTFPTLYKPQVLYTSPFITEIFSMRNFLNETSGKIDKINIPTLNIPSLGVGSSLKLDIIGSKLDNEGKYFFNEISCMVEAVYAEGSTYDDCQDSSYVNNIPYIFSELMLLIIFYVGLACLIIILSIKTYFYIQNRQIYHLRRNFFEKIKDEAYMICNNIKRNKYSQLPGSDKSWETLPYEKRRKIIDKREDYILIEEFFSFVKERTINLRKQENEIPNSNIEKLNKEIIKLYDKISNIQWQNYPTSKANSSTIFNLLIIPMIILSSIIMVYGIEGLLYYLIIGLPANIFVDLWSHLFDFDRELGRPIYLLFSFFIISFITRSIASFIMVYLITRSNNSFFNKNINYAHSRVKRRILISSIGINGLPSLFLVFTILTFTGGSRYLNNQDIPLIIAILIPLLDIIRFIIISFVIRSNDIIPLLYKIMSFVMLVLALLYTCILFQIQSIELNLIEKIELLIITIVIIQLGIIITTIKKTRYKLYYIGLINSIVLSIFWIIVLTNFSEIIEFFNIPSMDSIRTLIYKSPFLFYIGSIILVVHLLYITSSILVITKYSSFKNKIVTVIKK